MEVGMEGRPGVAFMNATNLLLVKAGSAPLKAFECTVCYVPHISFFIGRHDANVFQTVNKGGTARKYNSLRPLMTNGSFLY
ncbi:hypothetical protein J2S74_003914 [Evansella vedderi]|uniref:Uncharacterized protein n=1 Tax=Evansella vedderi TaxID=38282 RepID=A0ABU0A048_9BACI|nr:hypothetical protein [Evansella vedderi]